MKTIVFFLGGILGAIAGAGGMLIIYPYVFPPPAVNETVSSMASESLLSESRFREDAAGQDVAHWGRGGLKIYQAQDGGILLELQADFKVGPGPNFWLYFNTVADVDAEEDFTADAERIKLTKLKSFEGAQVYHVSREAFEKARALTVWCETFGQYIASANLEEPRGAA